MIVVMKVGSTQQDIDQVLERLGEVGLSGEITAGVERSIIGVIGKTFPELGTMLETLPGVDHTVKISRPYKLASREFRQNSTIIDVNGLKIGDGNIVVMAGPCSIENEDQMVQTARAVKAAGAQILRGGAFKPRTSPYSFRGLGEEGLRHLATARAETGMPVITEVMTIRDVELVARYTDILQIGARNMQNFYLLEEAADTGKPIMLKRALAGEIEEWLLCGEYILARGNRQVILCERGIRTFETATRNTMDLSAISLVKELSHLPIISDPSHGTGKWQLVEPMAMASIAAGADGLMIEVHPSPEYALSDGAQSLTFGNFAKLMANVTRVGNAVGHNLTPTLPAPASQGAVAG